VLRTFGLMFRLVVVLLCLGTAVLWARSYRHGDVFVVIDPSVRVLGAASSAGQMILADVDSWRDAGGSVGSVRELGGRLVITQWQRNHQRIGHLLSELRSEFAKLPTPVGVASTAPASRPSASELARGATHFYDVRDLLGAIEASNAKLRQTRSRDFDAKRELVEAVTDNVEPGTWYNPPEMAGTAGIIGERLVGHSVAGRARARRPFPRGAARRVVDRRARPSAGNFPAGARTIGCCKTVIIMCRENLVSVAMIVGLSAGALLGTLAPPQLACRADGVASS
jgi:hypothetical protein